MNQHGFGPLAYAMQPFLFRHDCTAPSSRGRLDGSRNCLPPIGIANDVHKTALVAQIFAYALPIHYHENRENKGHSLLSVLANWRRTAS
jgi:hypothetical protein